MTKRESRPEEYEAQGCGSTDRAQRDTDKKRRDGWPIFHSAAGAS